MNEYEIVIPLLNRAVLARLVTDLGGVADETQMMSDSYRYFPSFLFLTFPNKDKFGTDLIVI